MRTLIATPCRCVWCQRPIELLAEAELVGESVYHVDCHSEAERCAVVVVEEEKAVA